MRDPIALSSELLNTYLRYLDSAFPFRDQGLTNERCALLRTPGILHQEPIIEFVRQYDPDAPLAQICERLGVSADLAAFAERGLLPRGAEGPVSIYRHQADALKAAAVERKHVVVTTGTGSGKTLCFMLPVFEALLRESQNWVDKERPRAIRAFFLYPLNALAEDQMVTLRRALDSPDIDTTGARSWLQRNRADRFYFGRYTSRTPVAGGPKRAKKDALKRERRQLQEQADAVAHDDRLRFFFPSMDGAELWDRWSMQATPPDILVTNYSMLNVMLNRRIEAPMFESTANWLAANPENVVHLVVDELHSYRGTPGTEVAYLLRLLLHRLGLRPDSPQVRFLASSASLESEAGKPEAFLEGFFGASANSFQIIGDPTSSKGDVGRGGIAKTAKAFADYAATGDEAALATALGAEGVKGATFYERLCRTGVPEAISRLPSAFVSPRDLAEHWFGEAASSEQSTKGVLRALASAEGPRRAVAPMRLHLFMRNLSGLWACTNPECNAEERQSSGRIGKLYAGPRLVCDCGARVLDVLVCRGCGEIYFGGFRPRPADDVFLTHRQPSFRSGPSARSPIWAPPYEEYAVFWPSVDKPLTPAWNSKQCRWTPASLEYSSGRLRVGGAAGTPNGRAYDNSSSVEDLSAFPTRCARCDTDWRTRDRDASPLGPHRTGFQRVNQILADELFRQIPDGDSRKLVVFTDSRQDAAKLAAGMELDHYRDLVRQALVESFRSLGGDVAAALNYLDGQRDADTFAGMHRYRSQNQRDWNTLRDVADGYGSPEKQQRAEEIRGAVAGPFRLTAIETSVWSKLVQLGVNPGGPRYGSNSRNGYSWTQLIAWNRNNLPPAVRDESELGDHVRYLDDLKNTLREECVSPCVRVVAA
jgi:DEAD/DEAH box helicase domain-containing protein